MLEKVLEMLKTGKDVDEIAEELNVPREEVIGAMEVLASMGYIERVDAGEGACATCPLRNFCPGSCFRFKGKVYTVAEVKLEKSSRK
ncbi:helix-turn-helix domain-containing protein [Thermococcus pacificus]|uniref:DNA-binding protein n=1 Tax=Thermococcus pacificus TaxID=71998 RepID=A0A218P8L6_9EURY|nr:helix-turn-helix domain-containing protein [Thermococcus pacificus]ASJ07132.1 DNA-binding protein [Thermococcus pacificus]